MSKASKVINVILNVVLWFVVIAAAFFSIMTFASKSESGIATIGGFTPMTVLTDSMLPTFQQGDLIIVKDTDPSALKENDIISYWTIIENQRAVNTHRITEIIESEGMVQFVTKGDANADADPYIVSTGDIIGKYQCKVPILGSLLGLLSSSMGFLFIIVLPLLAFFVWQLYKLINILIEMKKEAVKEATKAAMEEKRKEDALEPVAAPQETEDEIRKRIEAEVAERVRKELEAKAAAEKSAGASESNPDMKTEDAQGNTQKDAEQTKEEEK